MTFTSFSGRRTAAAICLQTALSLVLFACAEEQKRNKERPLSNDSAQSADQTAATRKNERRPGDSSNGESGNIQQQEDGVPATDGQADGDLTHSNGPVDDAGQADGMGASDGTGSDTNPPADGGTVTPPEVKPTLGIGDTWTESVDSKSWGGNSSEPQTWSSRTRETKEIKKIFDDNQHCKYKIKTSTENLKVPNNLVVMSTSDEWCHSSAQGQCQAQQTCTEDKLPPLASGPYAGAEGRKKICTSVACSGTATQAITRTESQVWVNDKVPVPDNIVKRVDYTCQMQLRRGDKTQDFSNPCDNSKQRSVSYTRVQRSLESHKLLGAGGTASAQGAKSSITMQGTPVAGDSLSLPATCTTAGRSALRFSFSRTFCKDGLSSTETFESGKIDLTAPQQGAYQILANQATLKYEFAGIPDLKVPICPASTTRTYRLPSKTNCTVQLSALESDGVIVGKGSCTPPFTWYNSATKMDEKVQIQEFSFTCNAPVDFDFGIISGH